MGNEDTIEIIKKLDISSILKGKLIKNIDKINKENLINYFERYGKKVDFNKQKDIMLKSVLNKEINGFNEEEEKENIQNLDFSFIN